MKILAVGFAALCIAALAMPASADPSDRAAGAWRTLAVADVDALYASVRDIHPGYRDPETPGFASRVEDAYQTARSRARNARSYLDWRAATLGFMLSFRDGHTIYRLNAPPGRVRWPGFLIYGQGGGYVVRTPEGLDDVDADAPQGARVVSCDGVPIDTLLQQRLDGTEADWSEEPERIRQAYRLLIDYRTEGPPPLTACRVAGPGGEVEVPLRWRVELWSDLAPNLRPFNRELVRPIAHRVLPDGAYWLSLGNFGDEGALRDLAAQLQTQTSDLRAAPYIVLDLRGNRGGNSGWGQTFANLIWGEAAVSSRVAQVEAGLPPRSGKFWRASPAAAAQARRTADGFTAMGPDMADVARYFNDVAALIDNAPNRDRTLVEDPCCTYEGPPVAPPLAPPAYTRPVYLLTDAGCFSSCILGMRELRIMGAIVVGEVTGRNEEYGEVAGPLTTPSGLGRYLIPMTIIRQRPEALMVQPDRSWTGAMDDDTGIAAWIAGFADAQARLSGP